MLRRRSKMDLSSITRPKGANKRNKRVGRGTGSGHGTTSCRGDKGQKARAGYKALPHWEGGQMPLYRILGKSGFTNIFKKSYEVFNLKDLESLGLDKIDLESLKEKKIVSKRAIRLKILGTGTIAKSLEVHAHKVSKSAKEAIEKAKGSVTLVPEKKFLRIRNRKRKNKETK
jgi:large subunit ribosomal protein L15